MTNNFTNIKYELIVNNTSGGHSKKKVEIVAKFFNCKINEPKTSKEMGECAKYLVEKGKVPIVTGGDGTKSVVLNAVPFKSILAFIEMGTGNAFGSSFNMPRCPIKAAKRILNGKDRKIRLISCDGKTKAFIASIGIDGYALNLREERMKSGEKGKFLTYAKIVSDLIIGKESYESFSAKININGKEFFKENLLSFMALKSPYYGMGLYVAPEASLDAKKISTVSYQNKKDLLKILVSSKLPFKTFGGERKFAEYIEINTDNNVFAQKDGDVYKFGKKFTFEALKDYVYIRC